MTVNKIQFQAGLSMPDFLKRYGTEARCVDALMAVRWPGGFQCLRCGSSTRHVLHGEGRKIFRAPPANKRDFMNPPALLPSAPRHIRWSSASTCFDFVPF